MVVPSAAPTTLQAVTCKDPIDSTAYGWTQSRPVELCQAEWSSTDFPKTEFGLRTKVIGALAAATPLTAVPMVPTIESMPILRNYRAQPDIYELASLGPSPSGPTCGICFAHMEQPEILTLYIELNPALNATFAPPKLLVSNVKAPATVLSSIELPGDEAQWTPGQLVSVQIQWPTDGSLPPVYDAQLALQVVVTQPGEPSTVEVAPFELEPRSF